MVGFREGWVGLDGDSLLGLAGFLLEVGYATFGGFLAHFFPNLLF